MSSSSENEQFDKHGTRLDICRIYFTKGCCPITGHIKVNTKYHLNRFPWMKDRDPSSSQSSSKSQSKAKKPKLSVVNKKSKTSSKVDFIDSSDDDFVTSEPGPSKCKPQSSQKEKKPTEADIKRKKERERRQKNRLKESPTKKALDRKKDAERQSVNRAAETEVQHKQRIGKQAKRQAELRATETQEAHQQRIQEQAERQAALRSNETQEAHQQRTQEQAERQAALRANQTPEQQLQERTEARERMAVVRNYTSAGYKDARQCKDILQGKFQVFKLENTVDTIGSMTEKCNFCGALKFSKEKSRSTTCCSDGKVGLRPFPRPPEALMNLWMGSDSKARLFRAHSRQLNNAVCLSRLQVTERNMAGFNPSVVFQGRHHLRTGALLPAAGEQPIYAQLYIYDAALESVQRYQNLRIPSATSSAQKAVLKQALKVAQDVIHEHNPYVKDFKQVIEMDDEVIGEGKIVISSKGPSNEHARRYNVPTNLNEVCILMNPGKHDLIIQKRGGGLQSVSDLNPSGMPLHFTLLFPYGTHGWDQESRQTVGNRRITAREFYAFHLNLRDDDNGNYLHKAARLFQEWIYMAWLVVEDQRLNYQNQNQKALRADSYINVREATEERMRAPRADALYNDDHQRPSTGRKILASSFTGGPRYYNAKFQNGMAICRKYHKPDFFITMTCNPKWPEILSELLPDQTPQDRPDIVARVFKLKKDQLMNDIVHGGVLGTVVAHMHVIEFQKRGLPHAHILVILADHDRLHTPALVDSVVSAELPPSPDDTNNPTAKAQRQRLEEIVLSSMVHGPCGVANPNSPCMENGRCTKKFPKEFVKKTVVDPENSYATYMRRSPGDGGRQIRHPKTGKMIDNSWIVPYNAYLSLKYNCHINVEICVSPKAAQYLFKYATKGNDRAMVATEVQGQARNEILEYQDLRSVGSSEATWHLLNFPITDQKPAVKALRVHLKDQHQVDVFESAISRPLIGQLSPFSLSHWLKEETQTLLTSGHL